MIFSWACTDGYNDINRNPGGVTNKEKERDDYGLRSSLTEMQNYVIPVNANTFQFTDCLLGGVYGGYLADATQAFSSGNFANYSPPNNWSSVNFNDIIPKIYSNLKEVKKLTNKPVQLAVADIIKVSAIVRVTDTYGPIPYSQIGEDGKLNAPYDSQRDVYILMFEELDNAITALKDNRSDNFSPYADKVYGGNAIAWAKFANSLKLRLAMRLAYADPALAQQKAEEAANDEIGTFSSNSDNAFLTLTNNQNPFYTVLYAWNNGDSRISADILTYMNGFSDPRRAKYFTLSTFNTEETGIANAYYGLRSGIIVPPSNIAHAYSNMQIESQSKQMWMNASEVAFLKSEGALRGWNMGGTAQAFYEEGIRLSFEQWGVSSADAAIYLNDATNISLSYVDPVGANSYTGIVTSLSTKWNDADGTEKNLERIITQKWIAIFPLGTEAWAEFRRTGYPKLMPAPVNNSGGIVSNTKMARRLAYPQSEYLDNTANITEAISNYLKGPDNMATNVWWDAKP